MKKRNFVLFGILILFLISFSIAVINFFDSQVPADVNTFNLFTPSLTEDHRLNITYNISDPDLVLSTIKLYYKTNSTISDTGFFFVNGTLYQEGFTSHNYSSNFSDVFVFLLSDNQVYPATYNYNESYMIDASKIAYDHDDSDTYLKIRFFNVSNNKNFSFFEVYAENQTASSDTLRIYYCNESYTGNVNPLTSPFCTNFYNLNAATPFNHTHSAFSKHHVIPFSINTTLGTIGNVYVTNTSYFLLRGRTSFTSAWNVYYITNVSRTDTIQEDTNGGVGVTWNNFAGTVDAHLHQYDGTDSLWYYSCANDTLNNQNCTPLRQDLIDIGGLPPSAPNIYFPVNQNYSGNISINYTAAASPNAYPIILYNITLQNYTDDIISVITTNNSANLSYTWNTTETPDGVYNIHVAAYDSNYLFSTGESDDFIVDNTNPSVDLTCSPDSTTIRMIITCSCSYGDSTSGVSSVVFTEYPSTESIGTFSTICNVTDFAGNSATDTFIYTIKEAGSRGGGSTGTTTPASQQIPSTDQPPEEMPLEQIIDILVGEDTHTLEVLELEEDSARIIFSYDNSEQDFSVGEEKTFEVGEYIVIIKLERIDKTGAVFNTLVNKKPAKLDHQKIAIIAGLVILVIFSLFIILSKIKKHRRKTAGIKKVGFFKKLFKKIIPKKKSYLSKTVEQEILRKMKTAKNLREKANQLVEEAREKRKYTLRSEAMKKIRQSNYLMEKSKQLRREAKHACRSCRVPFKKFR